MREYALEAGGTFKAVNETFVEAWAAGEECGSNRLALQGPDGAVRQLEGQDGPVYNLFAFPAEDNFAGGWIVGSLVMDCVSAVFRPCR
jgi:hypothetical protein